MSTPPPSLVTQPAGDVIAVINPHASGVGSVDRTRREVRAAFANTGAATEIAVTHTLDEFAAVLRDAGGRRMALVGGDGGLHTLANLEVDVELPEIALIPSGRANNIAHGLGIPTELGEAAQFAVSGSAFGLDVLEVRTPDRLIRAVEGVSLGFQAAARAHYHAENSGAMAAGIAALGRTLVEFPHFRVPIAFDGRPPEELQFEQLFLSTLPYFAFGLRVDPGADPRDGVDEAIVIHASSRHAALTTLLAARRGTHLDGHHHAEIRRWTSAEIFTAVPIAPDGEPLGVTAARITVVPSALRVVATGDR